MKTVTYELRPFSELRRPLTPEEFEKFKEGEEIKGIGHLTICSEKGDLCFPLRVAVVLDHPVPFREIKFEEMSKSDKHRAFKCIGFPLYYLWPLESQG